MFPILDGNLRERITSQILGTILADNQRARFLKADGTYMTPAKKSAKPRRSQFEFIELATAKKTGPTVTTNGKYPRVTVRPSPFKKKAAG